MANALAAHGVALRRPRRDAGLERLPPPGAVLRGVGLGRRAAHAQPAAAPRPGRLDRRPCRGPGPVLRPDLPAAGRGDRRAREDHQGLRRDDRPRPHAGGVDGAEPAVLRGPDRRRIRPSSTWPSFDENTASSLCYTSGTTGNPKGALYSHRSTVLHTYAAALPDSLELLGARHDPAGRADVPRQRLGPAVRRVHGRRQAGVPGPVARRQVAATSCSRAERRHAVGRRADRLAGPAGARRSQRPEVQHHAAHRHRRLGLPAGDDATPSRSSYGVAGAARLGHDRDEPDRHGLHAQGQALSTCDADAAPGDAGQAGPRRCSAST